jgi:RHS repeat-associated protein
VTDTVTAANSNTFSYTPANRLASASGAWGSAAYSYDPVGNRLSDVVTGPSNLNRQASIDSFSNRLMSMTENGAALRSYTYDGAGNIITDMRPGETYGYTYNKRNRLASVTRNTVAYATYGYNALEQLTTRTTSAAGGPVGTIAYVYDLDGHLIVEANSSTGATLREYIWLPANDNRMTTAGGRMGETLGLSTLAANDNSPVDLPLAIVDTVNTTPTLLMVHTDHLGRPTRLTDATKATVWQATYKPWGEVQSMSGTRTQNLRFPGQYFQIETNLAYNHHRHYDPVTGRYTQADPLRFVDGPSIYAYAGNSPFMVTDRDGRFAQIIAGAIIGGGVNAIAQYWATGCIHLSQVGLAAGAGALGVGWGTLVADAGAAAGLGGAAGFAHGVILNGLGNAAIGGGAAAISGGDTVSGAKWGFAGGVFGPLAGAGARGFGAAAGGAIASGAEGVGGAAVGEGGTISGGGNGSGCGCGNGSIFSLW